MMAEPNFQSDPHLWSKLTPKVSFWGYFVEKNSLFPSLPSSLHLPLQRSGFWAGDAAQPLPLLKEKGLFHLCH